MKEIKLKPVTFEKGQYINYYRQNDLQQKKLLKAIVVSDDPKQWRRMIGVKTMAEVYRTLDKLAIRKEYHEALSRQGIDFDIIIAGIKDISMNAEKDDTRLKGYQTLLKSLGVDRYEDVKEGSKDWEKLILEAADENRALPEGDRKVINTEYEVVQPEIPEDIKEIRKIDKELAKDLYEDK